MNFTPCKGMRVVPSAEFKKSFPQSYAKEGEIIGQSRSAECWNVKWDEYSGIERLHKRFFRPKRPGGADVDGEQAARTLGE